MSEYQYYEFQKIDGMLTRSEQERLRDISSRAVITSTSFTNYYNYGGLSAEPCDMLTDFFDAHVHLTDWGDVHFLLKVPRYSISESLLKKFMVKFIFDYFSSGNYWILAWGIGENEDYDRFASDSGEGWMAKLVAIRNEIIAGDLRSLYLGWLSGVTYGDVPASVTEPVLISGLNQLTESQKALVEFLGVDVDLLAAAALDSPNIQEVDELEKITPFIKQLNSDQVSSVLKSLLTGSAQATQASLKKAYHQWSKNDASDNKSTSMAPRTLAKINAKIDAVRQQRLLKEKREQQRVADQERAARKAYLMDLFVKKSQSWKSVLFEVNKGSGRGYEQAVFLLKDLREAYEVNNASDKFQKKLNQFMRPHQNRRALIKRLNQQRMFD